MSLILYLVSLESSKIVLGLNKAGDFMVDAIFWSVEEVAAKAGEIYASK
jgi:hypothetical protein